MKHQYFGDVNDFRKYGLLRILTGNGSKRLGIFWMLTEDDGRNDGNKTSYLREPHRWRTSDPDLFDALASAVVNVERRSISETLLQPLIPNSVFAADMIPDNRTRRVEVFDRVLAQLADRDLVFIDPDNGFEVKSVPRGVRESNKYVYWDEVAAFARTGPSVIVYQHFPRLERSSFTAGLAARLREATNAAEIHSFSTAHVVFLLAPRRGEEYLVSRARNSSGPVMARTLQASRSHTLRFVAG